MTSWIVLSFAVYLHSSDRLAGILTSPFVYFCLSFIAGVVDGKAIDLQIESLEFPSIVKLGQEVPFRLRLKVILIGYLGFAAVDWPDYNFAFQIRIVYRGNIGKLTTLT